jgi:NADH dehydrogenase/NADH:ubiquinone oxidoreductase subunit G
MKKSSVLVGILFISSFLSCTNKEVLLPKIEIDGISEIQNHSSIWIFYKVKDNDTMAILNKNNKILNTHWIFNIDRRLTMGQIIPFLTAMQKNKNKDSMHKKEGMLNYFSYANTKDKSISLVNFNPTSYIFSNPEVEEKIMEKGIKIIEIDLQNSELYLDNSIIKMNEIMAKIKEIQSKDSLNPIKFIFKYTQNTSYQNYLSVKTYLNATSIPVDSKEYVYSLK